MNAKKALLITGAASIVGMAGLGGIASAANNNAGGGDTLVDKIATRFNLNKDEVQKVFDEDRKAHHAEREAKMEDRLTKAVADGKITTAQKDAILAKHAEVKSYMESLKADASKTPEERKALVRQKMDEVQQWARDNGLNGYFMLKGIGGPGGHSDPRMRTMPLDADLHAPGDKQ